jgi:uncharacterized protein (DUF849 family)
MSTPCIISVAITGSVPKKVDNPALPISVAEQIESTHEAFEVGAALVHVHVRDEAEQPSSDREHSVSKAAAAAPPQAKLVQCCR